VGHSERGHKKEVGGGPHIKGVTGEGYYNDQGEEGNPMG
jgi:hypothetical protein